MYILQNVPLSGYSTMRLGGTAAYATDINTTQEIAEAVSWARERRLPIIMIGQGSNVVWKDEGFLGLLLVNKINRYETYEMDQDTVYVTVGGGNNWDEVVDKTVQAGLSGIEFLSLIPGTAGAAPVQNIGAYGHELSEVLTTMEAYDLQTNQLVNMTASDCGFGYRTSCFKTKDHGRYLITAITMQLSRKMPDPAFYHSLESYFQENNIAERSPQSIRQAVIAVRSAKLPDPAVVANNGSFFANPLISHEKLQELLDKYPDFTSWHSKMIWELPDGRVKIAAGALLEHAGFKGIHDAETGMATWDKQALVLVNEKATSTADLLKFKQKITDKVQELYGITLEQEPEILP